MNTVICDIEGVINQRPLTYISEAVDDLTPLTPSVFLHDLKETGIPDLDVLDSSSLNKRHVYRQRVKQDLRKRFRTEYLGNLRQSLKSHKNQKPIQIGDIVLVSSDNVKKIEWPLARVAMVSKDGQVRLVKIKMKNGEFLRPVFRLIPHEVTDKSDPVIPVVEQDSILNEPKTDENRLSETASDNPVLAQKIIPSKKRIVNDFSQRLFLKNDPDMDD
ncbi:uncharacterized protein LOC118188025 [Stegodyphus dumicola]|uniref:uncharacterized protein LOC118188025 n=1 Tax=Stegodyphus dumicola TaxID=202533 RepID=UPI0015A84A21|nr:uncharacterized protein LOC118188025 [Stegodyphus dumicola]